MIIKISTINFNIAVINIVRPEIININSNEAVSDPFSIKKISVVTVVIILIIHMQKYVFPMF